MKIKFRNLFRSKDFALFLYSLYDTFDLFNTKKRSKFKNTSIVKLNHFMTKIYKEPAIAINKDNYIIPFRFYGQNDYVLNGIQYITDFNSKKWIISLHDFGQNKYWSLYFARPFMELGYNILTFDFSDHGDNKKVKAVTLGQNETRDLEAAIQWLTENKHPDAVGLIGSGLGAYTINNLYFEDPKLFTKNKIKFAICDSTYISVESLIASYYERKFKLTIHNRNKKVAKAVKNIFSASWRENKVNLEKNNLVPKFEANYDEILKNYVPFFFTNYELNNTFNAKDSLELMLLRDEIAPRSNKDKIVLYNFAKTDFLFRDHFKKNFNEILSFEAKIMGDGPAVNKAMQKLKVNPEAIVKSNQERSELSTFKIDK